MTNQPKVYFNQEEEEMRKGIKLLAAVLMGLSLFTSCNKEEGSVDLTATINGGEKSFVDSERYTWFESTDMINVNGKEYSIVCTHDRDYRIPNVDGNINGYWAMHSNFDNVNYTGNGTFEFSIPRVMDYETVTMDGVEYQKLDAPLVAYSTSSDKYLNMRNLFALIKFDLKAFSKGGIQYNYIESIEIEDALTRLNGTGKVVINGNNATVTMDPTTNSDELSHKRTLVLDMPLTSYTRTVYIPVPPSTGNQLQITFHVKNVSGNSYELRRLTKSNLTFESNMIYSGGDLSDASNLQGVNIVTDNSSDNFTVRDGNTYVYWGRLTNANTVGKFFVLENDLTLSTSGQAIGWIPANNNSKTNGVATGFGGTLDGQGHKVTINNYALFQKVNGTISNLTIEGTTHSWGAIACQLNSGDRCYITNCTNNATVDFVIGSVNSGSVGAFFGEIMAGCVASITDCINNATVQINATNRNPSTDLWSENGLGGFIGANNGTSSIVNCTNNGDIKYLGNSGSYGVPEGGILGRNKASSTTITNSTSTKVPTSTSNNAHKAINTVAGCVGVKDGGTIIKDGVNY